MYIYICVCYYIILYIYIYSKLPIHRCLVPGLCQEAHGHWSSLYDQGGRWSSNKWMHHFAWYDAGTSDVSDSANGGWSEGMWGVGNARNLRRNHQIITQIRLRNAHWTVKIVKDRRKKMEKDLNPSMKLEELVVTELSLLGQCSAACGLERVPNSTHPQKIHGRIPCDRW